MKLLNIWKWHRQIIFFTNKLLKYQKEKLNNSSTKTKYIKKQGTNCQKTAPPILESNTKSVKTQIQVILVFKGNTNIYTYKCIA